jgi:transposase
LLLEHEILRDHRSHATGATQLRSQNGEVQQGEQEVLHARISVGQTPGTTQRCPIRESARKLAIRDPQALVALHRVREQWMTTRTARINTIRGILREHGILLPAGARAALTSLATVLEEAATVLPAHLRHVLTSVHEEVRAIEGRIAALERELEALAAQDPVVTRLRTIPGIGLLTATALVGTVGHIQTFARARQFASWLGLTPREHSSAQRRRLGGISKRGDVYLRCLLTHGARAVLVAASRRPSSTAGLHHWARNVGERRGHNKATIAVANKLGRIVWAVWTKDVPYTVAEAA